jgi:hypothetical protein
VLLLVPLLVLVLLLLLLLLLVLLLRVLLVLVLLLLLLRLLLLRLLLLRLLLLLLRLRGRILLAGGLNVRNAKRDVPDRGAASAAAAVIQEPNQPVPQPGRYCRVAR